MNGAHLLRLISIPMTGPPALETGTSGTVFIRFCISARGMATIFDKASEKDVGNFTFEV
jgi:hypothetical protein